MKNAGSFFSRFFPGGEGAALRNGRPNGGALKTGALKSEGENLDERNRPCVHTE